ncbi:MAG: hypothetical protein QNK37_10660 [Acidobacteriota bacterium]|nr:hypothetical protein [Acidobacteriota bacterium]
MSKVYALAVPASSANLGPGYDVLGLALAMDLTVRAEPAPSWSVNLDGHGTDELPADESHLTVVSYKGSCRKHGWDPTPLSLHIQNAIPTCGGLGGSSAAVVAGLALAQLVHTGRVDRERIFQEGSAIEGHPDNVAPAVFGGLQSCGKTEDGYFSRTEPLADCLALLVVTPDERADTETMRLAMPDPVPQEVLDHTRVLLAEVMDGLASGNLKNLRKCSEDRRHQPYRFQKQPVPKKIFEIMRNLDGIHGAFLSGSGSAVAGWILRNQHPDESLHQALIDANIHAPVRRVPIDHRGLHLI